MLAYLTWAVPEVGASCDQWQDGRCAMCGERKPLVLDHDHDTGLTRGWLCHRCNNLEGVSNKPQWSAWRSGSNPATLLDQQELYNGHGWVDGRRPTDHLFREPTWEEMRDAIFGL